MTATGAANYGPLSCAPSLIPGGMTVAGNDLEIPDMQVSVHGKQLDVGDPLRAQLSVFYRRADGSSGWIEPGQSGDG